MNIKDVKEIVNRYLTGMSSKHERDIIESWYLSLNTHQTPFQVSIEDRLNDLICIKSNLDKFFRSGYN